MIGTQRQRSQMAEAWPGRSGAQAAHHPGRVRPDRRNPCRDGCDHHGRQPSGPPCNRCRGPPHGGSDEDRKLDSATRSALEVAERNGLESIALPAISTGILAHPSTEPPGAC